MTNLIHFAFAMLSGVTAQVIMMQNYRMMFDQCDNIPIKVFYGLYLFSKTISTFYALAWDLKYVLVLTIIMLVTIIAVIRIKSSDFI